MIITQLSLSFGKPWKQKEVDKGTEPTMENIGLSKDERDRITSIFSGYDQIEKVLLYGSRAKGNYQAASDIDLTLIGNNINQTLKQKIEFDLDDLLLPYKFDISIYHKISNPDFKRHIDTFGMEFYSKIPHHANK
jgi:uncharacterized protein